MVTAANVLKGVDIARRSRSTLTGLTIAAVVVVIVVVVSAIASVVVCSITVRIRRA